MSFFQTFCKSYPGANYFTWTDETFSDPSYLNACHCKAQNEGASQVKGVVSGPVDCDAEVTDSPPPSGCCRTLRYLTELWSKLDCFTGSCEKIPACLNYPAIFLPTDLGSQCTAHQP